MTIYHAITDHFGSVVRLYQNGTDLEFTTTYDPWGNQTTSTNTIEISRGYCGHEHWDEFGLIDMNFAIEREQSEYSVAYSAMPSVSKMGEANGRFYDPLLGRFLSPDPYVQDCTNPQNFNRYAYCLNNPLKYTDPSGEFWHIVIGAAIGGTVNWLAHGHEFSWKGFGYFNVGALAGAATAAVGGGMSSAMAGGSFWAGAGGTSAAMSVTSSFASGAAIGATTGAIGGTITEAGNAWMGGATFGQGVLKGFIGGNISGLAGGLIGGVAGGISAVSDGRDFWTGHEWETIADYKLPNGDLPIYHQNDSKVGCTQKTLESIADYYDSPVTINDMQNGYDLAQLSESYGFTPKRITPNPNIVGKELLKNHCIGVTYNNAGTQHTVGINRIQIQRCLRFNGSYKLKTMIQVMDPLLNNRYGSISQSQLYGGVVRTIIK